MSDYDLVLRGGTVVDGTGGPPVTADVAVLDGRIAAVGRVEGRGGREIDVDGALVTPGFVDVHTHYDGQATWDPWLAPSSGLGVTTAVMGNCGVGFAPVRPADRGRLIELMEGVEDIPGSVLHEGIEWEWETFPEYLDALDRRHYAIDVGAQLPHAALRLYSMGDRCAAGVAANPSEIELMARLAEEAVAAGAIGMTTSRTLNHRAASGAPTPTLDASVDEVVALAVALGDQGVLQLVADFFDVESDIGLIRSIARSAPAPMSVSLAQNQLDPGLHRTVLGALESLAAAGSRVAAQVAPRCVGVVLGLDTSVHPLIDNPAYRSVADRPRPERVARLRDAGFRSEILESRRGAVMADPVKSLLANNFPRMFVLSDPPIYEPAPGSSVADIAARTMREPLDVAIDAMLERDGTGLLYEPILNYADGNLDAVGEMLAHPLAIPGLGDGGAHVGLICDASFPVTLLAHWVRDRPAGRLPLATAVEMLSRRPARWVGLDDRGVVASGFRADMNVIELDRLQLRAPEIRFDLPSGGRRLVQAGEGIVRTFVAGVETAVDGRLTGATPGRLVRRGAAPGNRR